MVRIGLIHDSRLVFSILPLDKLCAVQQFRSPADELNRRPLGRRIAVRTLVCRYSAGSSSAPHFIQIFTFVWNDYFWAVVLISDTVKPVTAGHQSARRMGLRLNLISAALIVVAVPPVIMFFLMRRFIASLTMGAVKG